MGADEASCYQQDSGARYSPTHTSPTGTHTSPTGDLVRLIRITVALGHEVLDHVDVAFVGGGEEGSGPVLDSTMQTHNSIHTHVCWESEAR